MNRVQVLSHHLVSHKLAEEKTNDNDPVVVVSALRTPICKAKRGGLASVLPPDMLIPLIKETLRQTGVPAGKIGDVCVGQVLNRSGPASSDVRIACIVSGLSLEVPCHIVSRQCSSGLQAIASVAASIKSGYYDIGLAGGVESMSNFERGRESGALPLRAAEGNQDALDCYLSMGQTSENVASRYSINREKQDELAVLSHQLASDAQQSGRFSEEIVPIEVVEKDGTKKLVQFDDGIRKDTSREGLAKLKPAFTENGTTTAGNSSQVSDGAALAMLMKLSTARNLNLAPLAIFRGFAVVGCPPSVMGIGPALAIPKVLEQTGLTLGDIDLFELNEAFASQATYCVEVLGIPLDKLNVNGGAIALGHPLGCTGARQTATLLHELRRRKLKFGVVSMCIGTGMGAAAVYEMVGQ